MADRMRVTSLMRSSITAGEMPGQRRRRQCVGGGTTFGGGFSGFATENNPSKKRGRKMPRTDLTRILSAIEQGDPNAAGELLPLVYEELRKLAAQKMAQESSGQTLQATALVHE